MRKLSLIILLIAPLTLIAQVFIESETIPPHHLRSLATSLPFNRLRSQMDRTVSRDKKAVLAVRPHIRSTGFEVSQLSEFSKEMNLTGITDGDLVIGWADPDEEVTISGPYTLSGNLTIMNRGRLNIDEAEFSIEGDIFIMGDGEMVVTNSRFTVIQEYIYEYQATLIEQGELRFTEVAFHSSGQSWSIAMTGDARYILDHSEITDGFITTALLENATASISDTKTPGEFLCMGKNDIAFMRSDFLIFWLVLPDSSIVETALPGDSLLVNWTFPGEDMSIENIPYSVTIDSCTNVNWGLISRTGSDATFRDTEFRVVGMMFDDPDSVAVNNLSNGAWHSDEILELPDRNLHLIRSRVQTWNFYGSKRSNISINNCVFGEVLAMDTSTVMVSNSVCDGSGGYVGAFQASLMIVVGSLIKSQVISRESGVLVGALSSFQGSEIDADENAIMFLANTSTFVEPEAHESAVIFEGWMPHVEGWTESLIPISGTASLMAGPQNPIELTGYTVETNLEFENPAWSPTDGFHPGSVVDDTLAIWNTSRFDPGAYNLRLTLFHTFGDSISLISSARLDTRSFINQPPWSIPDRFVLVQNYPNPFNNSTVIRFSMPKSAHVRLIILDSHGRRIETLLDEELNSGNHMVEFDAERLPSGIYLYQIQAGHFSRTRRMLLIR